MTPMAPPSLPLDFRAETVEPILRQVATGNSCLVVGIGSVGKSNLMRFLQRQDVHQKWLGDLGSALLFVYVDTNKMLKLSLWGLWELMLHQLMLELAHRRVASEGLQAVEKLHTSAAVANPRSLAVRCLDRALELVCHQLELRLVFLIDEFDELYRTMPARGLALLRALRDEHKYRLSYVIATRLELRRLREAAQVEAFEELVTPSTFWLGPYTKRDVSSVFSQLKGEYNLTLDEPKSNQVIEVTGSHPGLLRAAFKAAQMEPANLENLTYAPQIQDECQRIWFSLSPEEQQVVLNLASDATPQSQPAQTLKQLYRKGVVVKRDSFEDHIFSVLFLEYVKQQQHVIRLPIYIDHQHHTVWVNGYESQRLTRLEYRLIAYLELKQGQVCSRDELVQHLYPDEVMLPDAGIPDSRIDTIVTRLRKRIEPNPKKPRYIITARGHGFQLMNRVEKHPSV